MSADKQIKEVLDKYGEDFASNTWLVPGGKARAILHKCIERMAAKAGITFLPPDIVSADPNNVVLIVWGKMGDLTEWSIGEANPKNNKNAYPYSMAEKRGKDRVALKLIGLHGHVYSEEEADDFKRSAPRVSQEPPDVPQPSSRPSGQASNPAPDAQLDDLVGLDAPARRSAHGAKKDGLWQKIEESLTAASGNWERLVLFTRSDWGPLPAAWPAQIVESWGKCVADVIAQECQTPAEVKHWCVVQEPHIKKLPPAYCDELRHVCTTAMADLRKMLEQPPLEVVS